MVGANSTRSEDWGRFIKALAGVPWKPLYAAVVASWPAILEVLHTGKNIIVEEARRWGFEIRPSKY